MTDIAITGRYLHFGAGPNKLPTPWENYDSEIDIRKTLPFNNKSAKFILAEHVIEHVLRECHRVLAPGGVIRLAFPDITRNIDLNEYWENFKDRYHRLLNYEYEIWYSILTDWGHQSCWTESMATRVLQAVGFQSAYPEIPGSSLYRELNEIVDRIPRSETTAIEAIRR